MPSRRLCPAMPPRCQHRSAPFNQSLRPSQPCLLLGLGVFTYDAHAIHIRANHHPSVHTCRLYNAVMANLTLVYGLRLLPEARLPRSGRDPQAGHGHQAHVTNAHDRGLARGLRPSSSGVSTRSSTLPGNLTGGCLARCIIPQRCSRLPYLSAIRAEVSLARFAAECLPADCRLHSR